MYTFHWYKRNIDHISTKNEISHEDFEKHLPQHLNCFLLHLWTNPPQEFVMNKSLISFLWLELYKEDMNRQWSTLLISYF